MLEIYNASVKPCPMCGAVADYRMPEIEAAELLAIMQGLPDGIRTAIDKLEVLCDPCRREMENKTSVERSAAKHARAVRKALDESYGAGMIPQAAKVCRFANSHTNIEARNIEAWGKAKNETVNLWICGAPGTGKTYMARCILNRAVDDGHTGAEITGIRLNDIGGLWVENRDKELKRLTAARIVSADDIDKAEWNGKGLDALWVLINGLSETKRRIIVTANVGPREWKRQLSEVRGLNPTLVASIWERMLPMHGIELLGESLRRSQPDPQPELELTPF